MDRTIDTDGGRIDTDDEQEIIDAGSTECLADIRYNSDRSDLSVYARVYEADCGVLAVTDDASHHTAEIFSSVDDAKFAAWDHLQAHLDADRDAPDSHRRIRVRCDRISLTEDLESGGA